MVFAITKWPGTPHRPMFPIAAAASPLKLDPRPDLEGEVKADPLRLLRNEPHVIVALTGVISRFSGRRKLQIRRVDPRIMIVIFKDGFHGGNRYPWNSDRADPVMDISIG